MTITRRNVLLGATASAALLPIAARAQTAEVVIGVIYPLSGGQRADRRRRSESIRDGGRHHQQEL